jgi:hypothetical protein
VKFDTGIFLREAADRIEFCEHRLIFGHTLIKEMHGFLPYFPYVLTDMSEIWYRMSPYRAFASFVKIDA